VGNSVLYMIKNPIICNSCVRERVKWLSNSFDCEPKLSVKEHGLYTPEVSGADSVIRAGLSCIVPSLLRQQCSPKFNFFDMAQMKHVLTDLEKRCPGEDHGCQKNGHYSIQAFQNVMLKKGYRLALHLNRMGFLRNTKPEWLERIVTYTSFKSLLIIGQRQGQTGDIYHCIAFTEFNGQRYTIDPDEGQRAPLTVQTLAAFLPKLSSVYGLFRAEEMIRHTAMLKKAVAQSLKKQEKKRLAKARKLLTRRQQKLVNNTKCFTTTARIPNNQYM
jgi:hypothetical protein